MVQVYLEHIQLACNLERPLLVITFLYLGPHTMIQADAIKGHVYASSQACQSVCACVGNSSPASLTGQYIPALHVAKQLPLISYKLVDDDR